MTAKNAAAPSRELRLARAILRTAELSADEQLWMLAVERTLERGRKITPSEATAIEKLADERDVRVDGAGLWSTGAVPTGKPVPTPEVLRNLPKRPPSRPPRAA